MIAHVVTVHPVGITRSATKQSIREFAARKDVIDL
jgi:hypothetical protein